MQEVNKCILCDSANLSSNTARVAPFIAERIWNKKSFKIKLAYCKDCGFSFYNPRLEECEIQALYENYRDENYQKQRYKHEPYYTKEINEHIGKNQAEILNRKKNLYYLLDDYTELSSIRSVLDFGGDRGQFIIDELNHAKKYVFDISGVDAVENVEKINDLAECKRHKYDLIMCCHVLEHVAFPLELIEKLKNLASENTVIYIETPFETPFLYNNVFSKLLSRISFLRALIFNIPEAFKKRNMILKAKNDSQNTLLIKEKALLAYKYYKKILSLREFIMHEHINFYTPQSLEKMFVNHGFHNLKVEVREINFGWTSDKVISCLATK